MKLAVLSLFCIAVISCKEAPKEMKTEMTSPETVAEIDDLKYPEALRKVFDAHGGLTNWKDQRTLSFEIPKPGNLEEHTIDLYSRKEKIKMAQMSMGSDGSGIWLLDENEVYKGDPVFYHNLMFYFYAMPFVLSDDGINYSEADSLEFEGKSFPGIRISYNAGVGFSALDEYYLHYDPDTFQMKWLGYTVTYRSGEKSDNVKWIRYNDWMKVNNLLLPKSLTWHEYEDRTIKEAREPLRFEKVTLSETALSSDFFSKPEGAKIVKPKK